MNSKPRQYRRRNGEYIISIQRPPRIFGMGQRKIETRCLVFAGQILITLHRAAAINTDLVHFDKLNQMNY